MSAQFIAGSPKFVSNILQRLFEGHGIEATIEAERVLFPAHPGLWATGELFSSYERISQLDFRFGGFDGDRVLVESIAGFGNDLNAQAQSAMQNFANASFHVLLPAFFGKPPCHGTERETWNIGGPRSVYAGLITSVFGFPPPNSNKPPTADNTPDISFYPAFIKRLETFPLPRGTHWIRIYQMRNKGETLANEVLLDNETWGEMQTFMADYSWPVSDKPYDIRVFLVVKDLE